MDLFARRTEGAASGTIWRSSFFAPALKALERNRPQSSCQEPRPGARHCAHEPQSRRRNRHPFLNRTHLGLRRRPKLQLLMTCLPLLPRSLRGETTVFTQDAGPGRDWIVVFCSRQRVGAAKIGIAVPDGAALVLPSTYTLELSTHGEQPLVYRQIQSLATSRPVTSDRTRDRGCPKRQDPLRRCCRSPASKFHPDRRLDQCLHKRHSVIPKCGETRREALQFVGHREPVPRRRTTSADGAVNSKEGSPVRHTRRRMSSFASCSSRAPAPWGDFIDLKYRTAPGRNAS